MFTDEDFIELQKANKDLKAELYALKIDAYYMRYHIHQEGLHDWLPEQRKVMEKILYDENDKLKR